MNNRNQKKVKRNTITLETKIAILNRLADGEGSTALGKEYKLGESTIRAIQKRANARYAMYILKFKENNIATNNINREQARWKPAIMNILKQLVEVSKQ
ncbi:hypothetical protein GQX74_011123 [Glossina fuscipes]|nr:hypothetical protein GQX74_011123 [Glossina fuscipes]